MRVRLTGLKQQNRKISTIKALRAVTGYGLRETKDIVDRMIHDHRNSNAISLEIVIHSVGLTPLAITRDMDCLSEYFHFESKPFKEPVELKLWKVTCAMASIPKSAAKITKKWTAVLYILASDNSGATNAAVTSIESVTTKIIQIAGVYEVKGPFKDGQVLCVIKGKSVMGSSP